MIKKYFLPLIFLFVPLVASAQDDFDIVILNSKALDPESETTFDNINIGIKDSIIARITEEKISGRIVIDASGLITAPGFIDVLSYDPIDYGVWYKIADGVTTNLALHGGAVDVANQINKFSREGKPLNCGFSFFYTGYRNILR
ncbi:MAG: hypothetical protein AB1649_28825 [Chloroflexota bacterium]